MLIIYFRHPPTHIHSPTYKHTQLHAPIYLHTYAHVQAHALARTDLPTYHPQAGTTTTPPPPQNTLTCIYVKMIWRSCFHESIFYRFGKTLPTENLKKNFRRYKTAEKNPISLTSIDRKRLIPDIAADLRRQVEYVHEGIKIHLSVIPCRVEEYDTKNKSAKVSYNLIFFDYSFLVNMEDVDHVNGDGTFDPRAEIIECEQLYTVMVK